MFLYFVCLYYSVLVIGGNEMGPKELQELVFMVVINLTGAFAALLMRLIGQIYIHKLCPVKLRIIPVFRYSLESEPSAG